MSDQLKSSSAVAAVYDRRSSPRLQPRLTTLDLLLAESRAYTAVGLPIPPRLASAITIHHCRAHRKKAIRLRRCLSDAVIHHG